jgi:hypothetical protein
MLPLILIQKLRSVPAMNNTSAKTDTFVPFKTNPNNFNAICDGNLMAAAILELAIHNMNKKKGREFYNTDKEYLVDGLKLPVSSLKTFRRAKAYLKNRGFLRIVVKINKYGRAQSYYMVDIAKVIEAIDCRLRQNSIRAISKAISALDLSQNQPLNHSSFEQTPGQTVHTHWTDCPHPLDKSGISTLSNISTNISSSSLEAPPQEEQPVAVEGREEEDNKYYGKEQPEESPVEVVEAPVKPEVQPLAANDTAIRPVDVKAISGRMLEICKKRCLGVRVDEPAKYPLVAYKRFKDTFNESFDEWDKLCKTIASSKYLMGEIPTNKGVPWDLRMSWILAPGNIEKVRNGTYFNDRNRPLDKDELEALLEEKKQAYKKQCDEQIAKRNSGNAISDEERKHGSEMFNSILSELKGIPKDSNIANRGSYRGFGSS